MDMRTTLPKWLTNEELEERGGSYTGTVENVAMRQVRNKFTAEDVDEPVITFTDGYKLVPNIGMRRDLMATFGHETDEWCDREITVRLRAVVSKRTGEVRWVKVVADA